MPITRGRRSRGSATLARRALACAIAATASTVLAATPSAAQTAAVPRSGRELVQRMHDHYAGKWFHTLTFMQWTTRRNPDGTPLHETWFEATQGDRLRIDIGAPGEGNGILFTRDSVYRVRGGKVARATADANPLLPFVTTLYLQPVPRTLADLAHDRYDMSAVRADTFEGRPVYVVGAHGASDRTSPQFWVDAEQLVLRRMLLPPPGKTPADSTQMEDIRMENYVPAAGGLLATEVQVILNGAVIQREVYTNWRVDAPLPAELFDAGKWMEAPHWVAARVTPGAPGAGAPR
ncbi:MAG TPA: hypothetical protein VFS44_08725 [Gemmatimonadaceae bacterium]|nr:hypothetical protein [Gemmatimonadaceae bacterium]